MLIDMGYTWKPTENGRFAFCLFPPGAQSVKTKLGQVQLAAVEVCFGATPGLEHCVNVVRQKLDVSTAECVSTGPDAQTAPW